MTFLETVAGTKSAPYLADHGFRDMAVLPGSFYVSEALRIYRDRRGRLPDVVREVRFVTPAVVSEEEIRLKIALHENPASAEFEFYAMEPEGQSAPLFAALKMDESLRDECGSSDFSIEAFRQRCGVPLEKKDFYDRLRMNQNQYGAAFQILGEVWRDGAQAATCLSRKSPGPFSLDSILLDAATQLLAALVLESGKTFVLKSIESLRIYDAALPATPWALAKLHPLGGREADGFSGDVCIMDETGKIYLNFSGVSCAFLDGATRNPNQSSALKLCVASTFTAEPIEDCLKFWGARLGLPVQVEFAPYNQVFQQFLDHSSAFHQNSDGANVVLVNLEDWKRSEAKLTADRERADKNFRDLPRHLLPNGLEIVHLNRHETDYVYQEIFEDRSYLKHGICLNDGATVIDIGANIGLFSLFVASSCQAPTIYAFEPSPAAFDRLRANGGAYIVNFHAFNCGVSDQRKTARFTFYEKSSVFSSFFSDETEDRNAIEAVARNILGGSDADENGVTADVRALTADRLRHTILDCPLLSVSDIIRENGLEKIDLLKIDAEKSEWDILSGIAEADWARLRQIVIEIHDRTGAMARRVERLLAEKGFHCAVEQEKLLEDSGLFNIYAIRHQVQEKSPESLEKPAISETSLSKSVHEFSAALASFSGRTRGLVILGVTPRAADSPLLAECERDLLERASHLRGVQAISSREILDRYPAGNFHDAQSRQLAHIPYSTEGFTAIGTALFRRLFNLKNRPFKVIALDCDNTLWRGECGEDGSLGVKLTDGCRHLQEFVLAQRNAGVLLCLCSRNNEEDVFQVFAHRPEMPLRPEHLTAWKINWEKKSDNLRALAETLGLGLDGFVFIDDNPVECADVRAACPEVLTLTVPRQDEALEPFLRNVWAFDHAAVTSEDRQRASFYRENASREKLQEQAPSLKDFIEGLELRVHIHPAEPGQLARISQLTFRTNQFNLTTIRRSEAEMAAFLAENEARSLVSSVSDRFGDYGLVSVLLYRKEPGRFVVDTFLLSCRALGRGVEHRILAELARLAAEESVKWIELTLQRTEKNQPALDFMTKIGADFQTESTMRIGYRFPTEVLAGLRYDPEAAPARVARQDQSRALRGEGSAYPTRQMEEIATELFEVSHILGAIERSRMSEQVPVAAIASASPLEEILAGIWKKVLGRSGIGLDDNFFDAGGTSLKAVLVVAEMRRVLKKALSIVMLFESPTIKSLVARLEPEKAAGQTGRVNAEARGQMRRVKLVKRRSALT